jgi:hypothetical protein
MLLWHVGRYGCPEQIQSDRGPQFVNDVIQAFKANIGTDTALSLVYSHQENGLVERANREVLRQLPTSVDSSREECPGELVHQPSPGYEQFCS